MQTNSKQRAANEKHVNVCLETMSAVQC